MSLCQLLKRKVREKFQGKIEVDKGVFQLLCSVPTVCTNFSEFSHIAFGRHVNLFNGLLFDIFVLVNKIFHHNWV